MVCPTWVCLGFSHFCSDFLSAESHKTNFSNININWCAVNEENFSLQNSSVNAYGQCTSSIETIYILNTQTDYYCYDILLFILLILVSSTFFRSVGVVVVSGFFFRWKSLFLLLFLLLFYFTSFSSWTLLHTHTEQINMYMSMCSRCIEKVLGIINFNSIIIKIKAKSKCGLNVKWRNMQI